MRILFVTNGLSNKGGTERIVCSLANLFIERLDYNMTIVNRISDKNMVSYPLNQDVNIVKLEGNYLLFYIKLRKFIQQTNFDFVIVHNMGRLSFLCSFLPRIKNTRFISLEHASSISYPKYVKALTLFWINRYSNIIVLTNADRKNYLKYTDNVVKIDNLSAYNVHDVNAEYNTNSKKIIAIGRLTYEKNFTALLSAWNLVNKKYQNLDWSLEIYGEGNEKETLNQFIIDNNIINVTLCGNTDNLIDVYKSASFLVMSSRYEGLGLVLIEAQSFGLPLIAFDCPYGPSEVITNNVDGLLIKNQNISALATGIISLINSIEIRKNFSDKAKSSAVRYTADNILKQWKDNIFEAD